MIKYFGVKFINAEPQQQHGRDGYKVTYQDGYVSWSPKDVFEQAYRPISGLTFGLAIEALKQGQRVTRQGWNGKGMFLWLKPATTIKTEFCKDELLKAICSENGGEIDALGTICMYTTNSLDRKAILTGWLASQTDMLSEDWEVIG